MPPSTRSRTVKRVWFTLAALMFMARCADQSRPYLQRKFGLEEEAAEGSGSAAHTSHAALQGLRLASWNLEWLQEPGRGPNPRSKRDYERLKHYAEAMRADLFAVQEVASEVALALVFPPDRYAYHLAAKGGSQRSGFVWKRSLDVVVHPDLQALATQNLRAGADVSIRMGEHDLRVLSIHLKAFCVTGPVDTKDGDCQKLKAQLPALEGWVDARALEGLPFAVVGDFNRSMGERDAVLVELDDQDPLGLTLLRASPTRKAACRGGRLDAVDHILLGGIATTWFVKNSFKEGYFLPSDSAAGVKLSDHCPLSIELKLPSY